jgi:hypothetical protein
MITKAQIAKLSAEDQQLLANLELSKALRRQLLLDQARGLDWRSRYFPISVIIVFLICVVFYYFNFFHLQARPYILYLPIGMGLIFSLVFHITRTNRRLDALLELLDFDRHNQADSHNPKDEYNG